jgi:mono/diheme cytochrome c family protein
MKTLLTTTLLASLLGFAPMAASAQTTAEDLYLDKCANCHGKDGAGQTIKGKKLKLKDLRSAEVQKMTDAQMTDLMVKGKGDMQSYSKELTAQQMKDLIGYMRGMAKK